MATVHPTAVVESGAELDDLVRECATVHRASTGGHGVTSVGPDCVLMASAHVAHDCQLEEGVITANQATLGGHVEVGRHGFSNEAIRTLKEAYRIVFLLDLNTSQALEQMEQALPSSPEVRRFIDFITRSQRGISK